MRPHGGPREARGAVRRAVPAHRLRAVESVNSARGRSSCSQYKSHSLDRHMSQTWRLDGLLGSYVASVPAQQRLGKRWFSGSADAILQSLNLIYDEQPDIIVVVGADHVYRMDFSQMIQTRTSTPARRPPSPPSASRSRWPTSSASSRSTRRRPSASTGSSRSRATPRACPTRPTRCSPRWATTSSTPTHSSTRCCATASAPTPATTWAATSSPPSSTRARRASTTSRATRFPGRPTATATTGATWEPSTRSSRRTRTSSRCCRCSTCTTANGRSSASS